MPSRRAPSSVPASLDSRPPRRPPPLPHLRAVAEAPSRTTRPTLEAPEPLSDTGRISGERVVGTREAVLPEEDLTGYRLQDERPTYPPEALRALEKEQEEGVRGLKVAEIRDALQGLAGTDGASRAEASGIGDRLESAMRLEVLARRRLSDRLRELQLPAELFTRCVEDPSVIGWWNQQKERLRGMVDRSYNTIEVLSEGVRVATERLVRAREEFAQYRTRQEEAYATTPKKAAKHEKIPKGTLLAKEAEVADRLLTEVESQSFAPKEQIEKAKNIHQRVLDLADQAAQQLMEKPEMGRSAEWKILQEKLQALEAWVDRARVHARREADEVCLVAMRTRKIGKPDEQEVTRVAAVQVLQEQGPLFERLQDRVDQRFMKYMNDELIPTHPSFAALFDAYQIAKTPDEAASLIRSSSLYSRLTGAERELVDRYIRIPQQKARVLAQRYEYHCEATWHRENEKMMEIGLVEETPARLKVLDAERVRVHGLQHRAYSESTRHESVLAQAVQHRLRVTEDTALAQKRFAEVSTTMEMIKGYAHSDSLRKAHERGLGALVAYAAADLPEQLSPQVVELQHQVQETESRIEATVNKERKEAIEKVDGWIRAWFSSAVTFSGTFLDQATASGLFRKLNGLAQAVMKEEKERLTTTSSEEWRDAAWKAVESMLDAELAVALIAGFEKKFVQQTNGPKGGALTSFEVTALKRSLASHAPKAVMGYLETLAKYLTVYQAYATNPLQPSQKQIFVEVEQEMRDANVRLRLNPQANLQYPYWEDARRYATAPVEEAPTTIPDVPEAKRAEFMKAFVSIPESLSRALYNELQGVIKDQVDALSDADRAVLVQTMKLASHPDKKEVFLADREPIAKLLNQRLKKLSFFAELTPEVIDRIAQAVQQSYS